MKAATVAAVAMLLPVLTGCLQPAPGVDVTLEGPVAVPILEPVNGSYQVTSRTGPGPSTVASLEWWPANATTAVLLVHGFSGVKENYWHTLPEDGYSWGSRIAASGRAVVAIDLPGYGDSPGLDAASGLEDLAFAVAQVASTLRLAEAGGLKTVGYGLSMGGYIVSLAAGLYGAFDAIVPTSSPHAGMAAGSLACGVTGGPECPDGPEVDFHVPNAKWPVINATLDGYEPLEDHAANLASLLAWLGDCGLPRGGFGTPCTATSPFDAVTDRITVPVLMVLGDKDVLLDTTAWQSEPGHHPASLDAQVLLVPDNGHFIHNHKDRAATWSHVAAWLDGHGL